KKSFFCAAWKVRVAQDHSKPCNDLRVWSLRKRQAILLNQTAKNPALTRLKTERKTQLQSPLPQGEISCRKSVGIIYKTHKKNRPLKRGRKVKHALDGATAVIRRWFFWRVGCHIRRHFIDFTTATQERRNLRLQFLTGFLSRGDTEIFQRF